MFEEEEIIDETGDGIGALSAMGEIDFNRVRTDPAGLLGDVYRSQTQAQNAYERTAKQQYEEARRRLMEKNYGPSKAEQLFAISQAFFAPKRMRGFAGAMDKMTGVFGKLATANREAKVGREEALAKLRDTYSLGAAERGVNRAKTAADLVKAGSSLLKANDPGVWSEQLQQFVPKNRPVITTSGMLNGRRIVRYSDGTSRLYNDASGTGPYEVLDRSGAVIGGGE